MAGGSAAQPQTQVEAQPGSVPSTLVRGHLRFCRKGTGSAVGTRVGTQALGAATAPRQWPWLSGSPRHTISTFEKELH